SEFAALGGEKGHPSRRTVLHVHGSGGQIQPDNLEHDDRKDVPKNSFEMSAQYAEINRESYRRNKQSQQEILERQACLSQSMPVLRTAQRHTRDERAHGHRKTRGRGEPCAPEQGYENDRREGFLEVWGDNKA